MLLSDIIGLWEMFLAGMQTVYGVLTTKLSSLLFFEDVPLVSIALGFFVDILGIGDWTVLTLMFSVGIPTVVAFSIVKWVLDIVPR